MHACNARHLGVVLDDHIVSSKEHVFSTQVVESVKQVNKKTGMSLHESDEEKASDSGKQQRETWGGVSASDKDSDDRSGFFSDYSTPRTRPPSHN
ncbi:hypothetical protein V6N13_030783 [Hibiscus sabdariffa]|uniref:Uncharacterized protein n=2 Tax=Hibiscus sabdariffa TaxID=183260 RepID=A0ABR1ZT21_9ROSI